NDGCLLCHVGALVREVTIENRWVRVGGIGSVMTAPASRRCGYARTALDAMCRHLIGEQQMSFLLLFCPDDLCSFYGKLGWQFFLDAPLVERGNETVKFTLCRAMVQGGVEVAPTNGTLDVRGAPW